MLFCLGVFPYLTGPISNAMYFACTLARLLRCPGGLAALVLMDVGVGFVDTAAHVGAVVFTGLLFPGKKPIR